MLRKEKPNEFKLSDPSRIGETVSVMSDIYHYEYTAKIIMEIVAPNGHCFIFEDETNKYTRQAKAIRAFMKFGRGRK